jgi:glycosyltransferase involved in cell wall biosynthesis
LRVSIVTPSYNQAEFLEETIRSVLEQGYPDLEYIIVDGGSKDGSVDIIRKYEDHLAWWVSERDGGQGEAINKGFARVTGDIIGWINSDDYYLPGAIQAAVKVFEENPDLGLIFGDVLAINGEGEPINVMTYGDWGLDELLQFNIIGQPSVFFRRSVLEKAGALDLTYHYLLDHELWLRFAQQAPIRYVRQRWSAARYHAQAKNVSQSPKYGADAYRIVNWIANEPALAERYRRLHRRILAGAHRINARYSLDGGLTKVALKAYFQGLWAAPAIILPEFHRILFALASLVVNVDGLRSAFLRRRKQKFTNASDPSAPGAKRP